MEIPTFKQSHSLKMFLFLLFLQLFTSSFPFHIRYYMKFSYLARDLKLKIREVGIPFFKIRLLLEPWSCQRWNLSLSWVWVQLYPLWYLRNKISVSFDNILKNSLCVGGSKMIIPYSCDKNKIISADWCAITSIVLLASTWLYQRMCLTLFLLKLFVNCLTDSTKLLGKVSKINLSHGPISYLLYKLC